MSQINYRSDFDFILTPMMCEALDDGTCRRTPLPWPRFDWTARLWTTSRVNAYTVSRRGDDTVNCFNDGGRIHVIVHDHRLSPGPLHVEFTAWLPNDIYPRGTQREVQPEPTGITLIDGPGDCTAGLDIQLLIPYIQGPPGPQGPAMTYDDLTPGQKAELGPITLEPTSLTPAGFEPRTGFTREEMKMDLFDDLFRAAVGRHGTVDHTHTGEDGKPAPYYLNKLWLTYDEAIAVMDAGRAPQTATKGYYLNNRSIRTNLPPYGDRLNGETVTSMFFYATNIETVILLDAVIGQAVFYNCTRLREILGEYTASSNMANAFVGLTALEELRLDLSTAKALDLRDSPKISLASLRYSADSGKAAAIITVHPEVYAKLTDGANTDWHQVLTDALDKNINFATI